MTGLAVKVAEAGEEFVFLRGCPADPDARLHGRGAAVVELHRAQPLREHLLHLFQCGGRDGAGTPLPASQYDPPELSSQRDSEAIARQGKLDQFAALSEDELHALMADADHVSCST